MRALGLAAALFLIAAIFAGSNSYAADPEKLEKRIQHCDEVLREIMQMPDRRIPRDLLSKCRAVAIFPYVVKGGFFFGARFGRGVVVAHDPETDQWKPPAFFTIGGGSFGLQFGAQAIDLILLIMNERSLESLLKDKFTLGGDAAVAAGAVGRVASADTDLLLKASIFSYSRSKGLFIGAALKGAVLIPDKKANNAYYNGRVQVREILFGDKLIAPASAKPLLRDLRRFSR